MMLVLKLKAPPFSINSMYYRNGNRTVEARAWSDSIFPQLSKFHKEIEEFRESFLPLMNTHGLYVDLTFIMPNLFTKSGKVSRHSKDCTNIEKPLVDLLFEKKYRDRGVSNLGLDDCMITELRSKKIEGPSFEILVCIKAKPSSSLLIGP